MYEPFFFVQELRAEGVSQGNLIGKATRQTTLPAAPAVVGRERLPGVMRGLRQGWSALQRRIVAPLIVESEAGGFGGVAVESPGGLPVGEGR